MSPPYMTTCNYDRSDNRYLGYVMTIECYKMQLKKKISLSNKVFQFVITCECAKSVVYIKIYTLYIVYTVY